METPRIAVAFMRSANTNQSKQYESIVRQADAIEAYANTNEYLVEAYFDNGIFEAEQILEGILGFCKACTDINYLIVNDSTRISRNFQEYSHWKSLFRRAGIEFISAKNGNETPTAQLMENVMQLFSQYDSAKRSESVKHDKQKRSQKK